MSHRTGGPEDRSSNDELAPSDAFSLLADPYRRHALYYLQEYRSATLSDLATVLTGWLDAARDGRFAGPGAKDRVEAELHHVHVPKLIDAGVVSYDEDRRLVRLDDTSPVLDAALAVALDHERTWNAADGEDETATWRP